MLGRYKQNRLIDLTLLAIATSACVVLVVRLLSEHPSPDFYAFWLAGKVWNLGQDPYGESYIAAGRQFIHDPALRPKFWLYPPQWMLAVTPLGTLSIKSALSVWTALIGLTFSLAAALVCRAYKDKPLWLRCLFVTAAATTSATSTTIYLGQTGMLTFLAMALLTFGLRRANDGYSAMGMVLLLLKPQLGVPIVAAALLHSPTRRPAAIACCISFVATTPFLLTTGTPLHSAQDLLANLSRYSAEFWNTPTFLVGPARFIPHSQIVGLTLLISATALTAILQRKGAIWAVTIVPLSLLPLHNYDLTSAMLAIFLAYELRGYLLAMFAAGIVLIHRTSSIASWLMSDALLNQTIASTVGLALCLLTVIIHLCRLGSGPCTSRTPSG